MVAVVGHLGHNVSTYLVCAVVSVFLLGKLASKHAPTTMAASFRAVILAASTPNWLLLCTC
jgi:hypothetical protein